MCDDGGAAAARQSAPRPAPGTAVDPVWPARRTRLDSLPTVAAPHFEEGRTFPGLVAEHGFSALVTVQRGASTHTLLFEAVVLSHGHVDHPCSSTSRPWW
jgi:7,8-dihydropterin-6-yl-methyl-4-(beta-D-ribofuranosyl)aminobenzene 5'-phosphate synthase